MLFGATKSFLCHLKPQVYLQFSREHYFPRDLTSGVCLNLYRQLVYPTVFEGLTPARKNEMDKKKIRKNIPALEEFPKLLSKDHDRVAGCGHNTRVTAVSMDRQLSCVSVSLCICKSRYLWIWGGGSISFDFPLRSIVAAPALCVPRLVSSSPRPQLDLFNHG